MNEADIVPCPPGAMTIDEMYAIPIGTILYHAYSTSKPGSIETVIKMNQVHFYKDNPRCVYMSSQKDELVMNVSLIDPDKNSELIQISLYTDNQLMVFLGDGNLYSGCTINNNYWFTTQAAADSAVSRAQKYKAAQKASIRAEQTLGRYHSYRKRNK